MNFWDFLQEENADFVSHEQRAYMDLLHHIQGVLPDIPSSASINHVNGALFDTTSIYPLIARVVIQLGLSDSCGNILEDTFDMWKREVSNE